MNQTAATPKRLTKQQWQDLISEQQSSTMNQSEFCRSKGLCPATFYNWKRKLNSNKQNTAETSPQWVELPVVGQPALQQTWDIELQLPGNIILRMRQ